MNFKANFETGVQGDEEKSLPEILEKKKKKEKTPLTREEYERYKEEGQRMIDSYDRFFKTFAKDVSLRFQLSDAFLIDFERGVVHIDTKWFAERGFSKDQVVWANLHELCHFRDLSEDPEAMLGNFTYMREQAKRTAAIMMRKYEEKFAQTNPEYLDRVRQAEQLPQAAQGSQSRGKKREQMTPMQQAAYKMHHTFYNILDDIYVNNLVSRKAPKYEEKRAGGQEVRRLYKEELFAECDYSKLPRHLQFVYSLLREEMIKDEQVTIGDEVKEVFERKIQYHGKEYSVKAVVEKLIKPHGGRDTKPGQRYAVIRETLEPIFNELLGKDLEEWDPQSPEEKKQQQEKNKGEGQQDKKQDDQQEQEEQETEEGSKPEEAEASEQESSESGESEATDEQETPGMNPFEGDYKQFDTANPDQFSEEDIEKWIGKHKEDRGEEEKKETQKKEEVGKSAEEKAAETQNTMDKKWAEENAVKYENLKRFREIEREIEPYLQDLSELWRYIVLGSTPIVERHKEGYFKTGELDIPRVIEEYPKLERRELDEVRVMKRTVSRETGIQKPELIRVRLVGDMSGSMATNEEKKHILQQCFVLILTSLREFNTYLNMNRQRTKSRLEVDTEAWVFGTNTQKIKRLRKESGLEDEQVQIVKIFDQLTQGRGDTNDGKPLGEILGSLSGEDKQKISQEKILELVFEITDGGSTDAEAAKKAITALDEIGVVVKAFQIGQVNIMEGQVFNHVWNEGRAERLGEVVGTKINNLLPALTAALKNYLGNVRL